ncbi:MAG: DNA-processing protein DprA [Fimbriimonadaceae bacterium]|nr:DNA-processing protein DprA [Fimbriimonadaceae bacterium]
MSLSPAFWNALLAAEMPGYRSRPILDEILKSRAEPLSYLLTRAPLTPAERERVRNVNPRDLESVMKAGATLLSDSGLPDALLESPNPPLALFAWGKAEVIHQPTIAIVGTRGATTYGKAVAMKFAEVLAAAGVTIVSGGALGIDGAAHRGALAGGGSTIAVLATGIDGVYPTVHRGLFQHIREHGCLISQFAAGTKPMKHRFVVRNYLVAAISQAVLVVEAPEKSGALNTAHVAAEMGRPVYVVSANIDNLNFRGSHALIRDGAILTDHPDIVLHGLGLASGPVPQAKTHLSTEQEQILAALSSHPTAPELIVAKTGLAPEVVLSELTMLELDGFVLQDLGGFALRPL